MSTDNSITKETDWTISELYSKSWEIVKKYKILWIFGMAAGAAGGGSNFSNFSRLGNLGTGSGSPTPTPTPSQFPTSLNGLPQDVLGSSTATGWTQLLSHIPVYLWVVLGLEILILFLFFWAISILYSAWANGSLINAIDTALAGKSPTIRDASEKSFKSMKSLAWLFVVPGLVLGLGGLGIFGGLGLLVTVAHGVARIVLIILISLIALIFLYFLIYLSLSQIWALRAAVLDNKGGKEALFAGYRIARKKKWAMIGLGSVNTIAGIMVFLVPIAVIAILIFLAFLAPALIVVAVVLAIPLVIGLMVLGGMITAFKASTWTIAYKNIKGKYE